MKRFINILNGRQFLMSIIMVVFFVFPVFVFASNSLDKDDVLIYADKNGTARGYDLLWVAPDITGTYPEESPVLRKDDVLYVTSLKKDTHPGNNDIFALDSETGEIIDRYTIGSTFGDAIILDNTLYIGTGDESWGGDSSWEDGYAMFSFDISDIRNSGFVVNWRHPVPARIASNILYDDDKIYFAEFEGDQFIALNRSDGSEAWSFTKEYYGATFFLMHGDYIYVSNSGNNSARLLYLLDKSDGTPVWTKPIIGTMWDNSITYSPDQDALFMTFSKSTPYWRAMSYSMDGDPIWEYTMNCKSLSYTAYHNNSVFFVDLCGWVYSLNAVTGAEEWAVRIGKTGHKVIDIASVIVANDQIFVGTKGSSYPVDSRGRGAFYVLDESTGDVLWTYQEDDLGDIMSLATVAGGMFYNVTDYWEVYAFDIGDGTTSDHTISTYDTNNTFSTETALTQNKYVELICTNSGTESTCNVNNSYTGRVIETKVDMDDDVIESVMLENGDYHINVDGSYVYMPVISALGNIFNTVITSDIAASYNNTIPRLMNIVQDDAALLQTSYNQPNKKITLIIDNTTVFDAEIENFSKPFINSTSILDNSSTVISTVDMNGITEINSTDMEISILAGTIEINVSRWGAILKTWTEVSSEINTTSSHLINNLKINTKYILIINGNSENIMSDENGEISFDANIENLTYNFSLKENIPKKSSRSHYSKKELKDIFSKEEVTVDIMIKEESKEYSYSQSVMNYSRLIKKNMEGEDVRQIQIRMNSLGYTVGGEDGIYGPLTYLGVTAYQRAMNLQWIDGIVGPETISRLNM